MLSQNLAMRHHVYNHQYKVGEELSCVLEANNAYNKNAIAVKDKNKGNIVGHIPESLTKVLYPLSKTWKVYEISCKIKGQSRKAPEGTWVLGGGPEHPCCYSLYGPKIRKREVRDVLKNK